MVVAASSLSVAVMVTVCDWSGPSLVLNDHDQVPLPLSVTVPIEADRLTLSCPTSPNVPVLLAV